MALPCSLRIARKNFDAVREGRGSIIGLSLYECLLEVEDDPGDIILFPPEDGAVTDVDSGDEIEANILHFPNRMLRSHVEIQNSNISFTSCGKGDCDEEVFSKSQKEISSVECFEKLYGKDNVDIIADMITKVDRIRFVDKKLTTIQIDCPAIIKMYNKYMSEIDRFDDYVNSMRVSLRGKKWWFPLFAFGLDAACQNAWLIRRQSEHNRTFCVFRRNVATIYLQKYGTSPSRNSACSVPMQVRVPSEINDKANKSRMSQERSVSYSYHHHHQPIKVPTAGAQAFPMDGIGRLGHDPPRGPTDDVSDKHHECLWLTTGLAERPINVPTAGAQAFPMDGIGKLGHDPPRGPSADWRVLTTADATRTTGLTCHPKHGGTRDRCFWSPIQ
ncbi:hypothetical protein evm_011389 [Chilo suppressalis]|nr:hypothetical protein evm_011389 [Chilo suppressalis]